MYSIKRFLHFPSKLVSSFSASEEMTVFQSSFIQKMFWQNVWVYALRRRSFPVTYVVFDDNHPALVFPALQRNNMVELAGSVNGISSLSPIYFENTANYPQCLKYLIDCLPATTISFDRIIDHTPTSDLLKALQADETYLVEKTTSDNVEITFSDSYENWYSGLKKSVRQNLRTAYNRVNTDSLSIQFDVWHGGAIPSAVMHELVQVYSI